MKTSMFLKINITSLIVLGVWPLQLKGNLRVLNYVHKFYWYVVFTYFLLFELSQFFQLFLLKGDDIYELVSNLAVSLTYSLAIVKALFITGKNIKSLMRQINEEEYKYLETKDEIVKNLYLYAVKENYFSNRLFIFIGVLTITPFYINPVLIEWQNPPEKLIEYIDNSTIVYLPRPLPFSSWFPFDRYKYYYVSYFCHIIAGTLGAFFVVISDIMYYGLIIYPIGQIKILQHYFTHFKTYAKRYMEIDKEITEEEAIYRVVNGCIKKHKTVIQYIEDLDLSVRYIMLLDFALASMQMAMLGFQIIYVGLSLQLLFSVEYLVAMLIQLFLFYWHANEILLESEKISEAIYNSDWFDCSPSIKKTFLFIMMRASKPLTLNVGPFYAMSTATALSILRAAYSYVALLRQTYLRKEG